MLVQRLMLRPHRQSSLRSRRRYRRRMRRQSHPKHQRRQHHHHQRQVVHQSWLQIAPTHIAKRSRKPVAAIAIIKSCGTRCIKSRSEAVAGAIEASGVETATKARRWCKGIVTAGAGRKCVTATRRWSRRRGHRLKRSATPKVGIGW